ncbi:MAG: hypothetical protein RR047_02325 [Bacilli bacterium]
MNLNREIINQKNRKIQEAISNLKFMKSDCNKEIYEKYNKRDINDLELEELDYQIECFKQAKAVIEEYDKLESKQDTAQIIMQVMGMLLALGLGGVILSNLSIALTMGLNIALGMGAVFAGGGVILVAIGAKELVKNFSTIKNKELLEQNYILHNEDVIGLIDRKKVLEDENRMINTRIDQLEPRYTTFSSLEDELKQGMINGTNSKMSNSQVLDYINNTIELALVGNNQETLKQDPKVLRYYRTTSE